jgi:hypothetical protein
MCANLAGIYSAAQDVEHLWAVLELLTAANPTAKDYLSQKVRHGAAWHLPVMIHTHSH